MDICSVKKQDSIPNEEEEHDIGGPWYINNFLRFCTYEFKLRLFDIFCYIVFRKIVPVKVH